MDAIPAVVLLQIFGNSIIGLDVLVFSLAPFLPHRVICLPSSDYKVCKQQLSFPKNLRRPCLLELYGQWLMVFLKHHSIDMCIHPLQLYFSYSNQLTGYHV